MGAPGKPLLLWGAFGLLFLLPGCQRVEERPALVQRGWVMGTSYLVKVTHLPGGVDPAEVRRSVAMALAEVDRNMSTYLVDSEVSRFNQSRSTDWFPVSKGLATVVAAALEIGRKTGGAYDITVAPLVNLWGFGPEGRRGEPPPSKEIEHVRRRVGYRKLSVWLDPPALRKEIPELQIDLSSIAKGYGVDRAAQALERFGIQDYLIEVGGEVRTRGERPGGGPWRVAIERPHRRGGIAEIVPLSGLAIATSGDYRNYFEKGGRRYSHTIDPRTGRPVQHHLTSVSVLHREAMWADGWATALMVLGEEEGFKLAERETLPALLMVKTPKGVRRLATSAWKALFTKGTGSMDRIYGTSGRRSPGGRFTKAE